MNPQNNNHKILVIEDEALIAEAIMRKLNNAGYTVESAQDGQEGLNKALSWHPDLILLDIILPTLDGMTILDKLREDEWGKDVKVIVLTNLDTDKEFDESRKKGVHDYLIKTNWTLEDVLEKIKERLEN